VLRSDSRGAKRERERETSDGWWKGVHEIVEWTRSKVAKRPKHRRCGQKHKSPSQPEVGV
jgi:hypothetical protein